MDTDRPPYRCTSSGGGGSTTSELFICFTSRLSSSSSMKISSKSILSPGRARDSSQISLSTSLSRRLRSGGSLKGGQASPMFPATNGKKRGCNSFENPEPSSPKVTCIGQVRVKTKKQGKKMRARSKSRREVSFRKTEQTGDANGNHFHQFQQQECLPHHRNQRWVHLPVTICEALRAFGAEFNCFLPCRSSCMASDNINQRDKEERATNAGSGSGSSGSGTSTSCGAVFARWLVAEKIELVVGEAAEEEREKEDDDYDDDDMMPRRSQRRHVFEDIVIEEAEKCVSKNEILEADDKEEGRVSICVPPKNALLLMRCRSDPVKMAALANRFWECPPPPDEAEEDNEENRNANGGLAEEDSHHNPAVVEQQQTEDAFCEKLDSFSTIVEEDHEIPEEKLDSFCQIIEEEYEIPEAEAEVEADVLFDREEEDNQQVQVHGDSQKQDQEEEEIFNQTVLEEETVQSASPETFADPEDEDNVAKSLPENEDVLENEPGPAPKQENEEAFDEESEEDEQKLEATVAEESIESTEKILHEEKEEEEEETVTTATHERSESEEPEMTQQPETGQQSKERGGSQNLLPDCLLMMMCSEPKLSMEVSKETWVCSTDFIRWHPSEKKPPAPPPQQQQQIVKKRDGCDEPKKRLSIDLHPAPQHQIMQPPRSSCSFPLAPPLAYTAQSMNTMVEQKLVGAKHSYEPFVLTRCKSEPLRSTAKLAAEACFWKNRKVEPHRAAATLGVGATGVGF